MGIRFADPHPRVKAKKNNDMITDPPTQEEGDKAQHSGLGTKLRWAAGLGKKK